MIDITSKINEMTSVVNSNLSQSIETTGSSISAASAQRNTNPGITIQEPQSDDSLMNQIGLAVQRQGGQ